MPTPLRAAPAPGFGTKGQTLQRLRPLVRQSQVLDLEVFDVGEWRAARAGVLERVRARFGRQPLVVRSSAVGEDGAAASMAGAFTTRLGVNGGDRRAVARAVDEVVASYAGDPRDQVLVQPMIASVQMSGVAMTRALEDGAPYYVVNYDDESGRTDSITGGTGVNKTVYVHRGRAEHHVTSDRIRRVLAMVAELEALYPDVPLDVEFCFSGEGVLHLLQVRRVAAGSAWRAGLDAAVEARLPALEAFVERRSLPRPGLHGRRTVLGTMPDWNPAEILGTTPHALAASLYRRLVTRSVWREARARMGYRALPPEELMVVLYGRPYIDVRCSFNSLLPAGLSAAAADPLVDAWIDRLTAHPELHDKVEFEVAQSCLDLGFRRTFDERYAGLGAGVRAELELGLRALTRRALADDGREGSLAAAEADIARLEARQAGEAREGARPPEGPAALADAARLLHEARELGTRPFAITARHAFIAEALLRSAVAEGVLDADRVAAFRRSVRTVSREFAGAMRAVVRGEADPASFLARYGHLRPGTYDVQSLPYAQRGELFASAPAPAAERARFRLRAPERRALDDALRAAGLDVVDAGGLLAYASRAIAGREYAKFVFTRSLSAALERLAAWGAALGLDREAVSHLDWETLERGLVEPAGPDLRAHLAAAVERGRETNEIARALKLGFLIREPNDLYVVPQHRSQPNFVGRGRVSGPVAVVGVTTGADAPLEGRVAVIENADPGFDWIFSRGIAGLVTRYGGANSHMSIRCAEFGLPAAIGCGEQVWQRVAAAGAVEINCLEKVVRPLDDA